MTTANSFTEEISQIKLKIESLPDNVDRENIEQTALRLEGLNYAPPLFLPVATFLRLTNSTLAEEIDRIVAMSDSQVCQLVTDEPEKCQDMRLQLISVLVYYYRQLVLLRQGDAEAWDEVDELYVHD